MKIKLSYTLPLLCAALCFCSCRADTSRHTVAQSDTPVAACETTEDMGQEYIDGFIFIGESTTYHLKSRGVLRDGTDTRQVWAPRSGTINLDSTISSLKIVFPDTGEEMTVGEAMARKKPPRVLLTFGLNGAVTKIKKGEKYFRSCYLSLINAIRASSPDTSIILQSCFPIAADMDMSNYSVDSQTLMSYIDTINSWTHRLARDEGLGYLNTAEVLKNSDGFLISEYHVGDGHHLTTQAYIEILKYIRTHAVTEEK